MYNFGKTIIKLKNLLTYIQLYDIERLKNTELREVIIKKIIQHLEGLLNVYRKELHRYD